MGFVSDLKDGLEVEDEFVDFLQQQGVKAQRNTATTLAEKRLYDVFTPQGVLYEVKFDKMWTKTGNIYIEDGALETSKADFFVYKLIDKPGFFWMTKADLKALLKDSVTKKVVGGDFGTPGTLIKLKDFVKHFKKF